MDIDDTTIPTIFKDYEAFKSFVLTYLRDFVRVNAGLIPQVSESRLKDVHTAWVRDIARVGAKSFGDESTCVECGAIVDPAEKTPDHFKHAAHLAYWMRRAAPVIDFVEPRSYPAPNARYEPPSGTAGGYPPLLERPHSWHEWRQPNPEEAIVDAEPITPAQKKLRDLLFRYGTEVLAFDLGYSICVFYERGRLDPRTQHPPFEIDEEYIETICCFLKEKNVSPHALFLIYKSLLYKRFV